LGGASAELGYLSRAVQVAGLAPLAVQGLMPVLFNHWAGRSDGVIQNNVRECALAATALIVPVTVVVLLLGREIMSLLFGAEFRPAYAALVVLQFMALPLVLMNLLTQAMGSRGTQQWTIVAYGGSGAVLLLVAVGAKLFLGEASALTVACGSLAGSVVGTLALIAALWRPTS
jgi:O-antigen/teichoic acid export membrane protein